ncbi:membrane protease YdiL (CAAX protease family) [Sphingomonas sp. BE138]|uniref:CPBP family intramembrane glutamic endopeptidase n=1 Tax=Sphingomonas sp. BE138 TaxID=2817845 RepID=UPI0028615368|nr:CPBP family intramembrane glutamic endopeptidase [Sphingomonas sp. BE138]MDR6786942.1 membrane protease YdiL (CAAX protease family) [Sphingomonas sp. BE138]
MTIAVAALAVALASLALHLHGARFGYWPRAAAVPAGTVRHRYFARLALRSLVHFGLVAVVLLGVVGAWPAIGGFPAAFVPARAVALSWAGQLSWEPLAVGGVAGVAIAAVAARRGWRTTLGDARAVLPVRRAELGWGVVLAIVAGVTEELFFRLLLPLSVVLVGGSAVLGFAVATLLFGYAHLYQGWRGVVATVLAGVVLALVYLVSAKLWVAMLVHAVIDLNGLVLRPVLAGLLSVTPARAGVQTSG